MGEYDSKVVSFQQESGFVHQRALMNWRAGNYPDALNLIRKAVESDPTDARCRLDMARILVSMELYEAAGRQLMWLLSEARELEECLFLSGKILYARGRQEEAENVLRAYVDHSGGHESVEEAERMLDRIYLNSEIQEEMAEDRRERRVQKLIEEGIRQLETLGDSRSSEQAFGHAVRLNPLRVSAHALYAVVLNLNGKPEDARREAIMAGRLLGPSAPLPDVCICAQALYESGMREEGRELMSRAREMDADDEGKRVRVTALERLEMYDEACEAQGELVAAHPYNPAMLHEMSCLAFLAGKPAEMVANGWKRIHRLDPADPAPEVLLAIDNEEIEKLRLYSDPEAAPLIEAAAGFYGVGRDMVMAGNGSDEVLAFLFMAFQQKSGRFYFPEISYSFYPVYCSVFGAEAVKVPLKEDFSIDPSDYYGVDGTIIITNPNAPTGIALTLADIEEILQHNPEQLVVIDEAYVDFGAESAVSLLDKYDNLLVVQTFSKSRSLAGARVGLAISNKEIIEDLNRIKFSFNPYNLNRLSILAGTEALKDVEYFNDTRTRIMETREDFVAQMEQLGFTVLPS